ncbi:MAG: SBBP repeat-containing protein [Thermoplasmatota archaeon]
MEVAKSSRFIENLGQWDRSIDLMAETHFGHIALGRSSLTFDIRDESQGGISKGYILRYDMIDSNGINPEGSKRLPGHHNYYYGAEEEGWFQGARSFEGALYDNIWGGIDLDFSLGGVNPKYEFILEPFADPSDIRIGISGHETLSVIGDSLRIELENGLYVYDDGLKAYYADDPAHEIPARFKIIDIGTFSFDLDEYDISRSVVIDPILIYSTFAGGTGLESWGISTLDEDGNIYMVGSTWSSDFPTTPGAYCETAQQMEDVIVYKTDETLSNLVFSTYIGGTDMDSGRSIDLSGDGDILIAGMTYSQDFPTTEGAYDRSLFKKTYERDCDLFVLRLNNTGSDLIFSTYVGDFGSEKDPKIAVDEAGNSVITATVFTSNFTTTPDAYSGNFNGLSDLILFSINQNGTNMTYSTFIGGEGADEQADMVLYGDHLAYITGRTNSTDFPTTDGAYDTSYNVNKTDENPFVLCFNLSSGDMEFSTYVSIGSGTAIDLDQDRNIYLGGTTRSRHFKTTSGSFQEVKPGNTDSFVLKMDPNATALLYSTFIGGTSDEHIRDIDVNETGCAFITGITFSLDFPCTPGSYDSSYSSRWDTFVTAVTPDGSGLQYSSFIGSQSDDMAYSINVWKENKACISGVTYSSGYPTTSGSLQTVFGGVIDHFISVMNCTKIYLPPEAPLNLTGILVGNQVLLDWEEPEWDGDSPVLGYNISRGLVPGSELTIDSSEDTCYTDSEIDVNNTYYYYVKAYNRIGTSQKSTTVRVEEREAPVFCEDLTPDTADPGMDLRFSVKVRDNGQIRSVHLIYSVDGEPSINTTMIYQGEDVYDFIVTLPDREFDLEYHYHAVDSKKNRNSTLIDVIPVRGDHLPIFFDDLTPSKVDSLSSVEFNVSIDDNWGISEAFVEYWINDGYHRNRSMAQGDNCSYKYRITATGVPGDRIRYFFSAVDVHGNWNSTMSNSILIVDHTSPILASDSTLDQGTTGDPFLFLFEIFDEDGPGDLTLIYRIGSDGDQYIEIPYSGDSRYEYEITLPHTREDLSYRVIVRDRYDNILETEWVTVEIIDNDRPILQGDESDYTAVSGSYFNISCLATDNIAVERLWVEYRINNEEKKEMQPSESGSFYNGSILIPNGTFGYIEYSIRIVDPAGNIYAGSQNSISIVDGIPPMIDPIDDLTTYVGQEVSIEIRASDDHGINTITWHGLPDAWTGIRWTGSFQVPGTKLVEVRVVDNSGNSASIEFTIEVLPVDHDKDGDGLPDLIEARLSLSPDDPSDALLDLDGDGLTNLIEYQMGTLPDYIDSDNDGLPDGWEHQYGTDPLSPSGDYDKDGDGFSNLEEYVKGTDPNVPEEIEEQDRKLEIRSIDLVLIALSIFCFVILLFIVMRRIRRS